MTMTLLNILLVLSSLTSTKAGEGVITTLEAPIYREQNITSPVVQTARKGDVVYIHNKHLINGPIDVVYGESDQSLKLIVEPENPDNVDTLTGVEPFYETIDRSGQTAYIPTRFVKLITKDRREFSQLITPYDPDPNDYRPEEPLPSDYPFHHRQKVRAQLAYTIGPDIKSNYNYGEVIETEDYAQRSGAQFIYGRKANWDDEDRFYFGAIIHLWASESRFKLYDDRRTVETKNQMGIGPFVSYDPWRDQKHNLTFQLSLPVNYNRSIVEQTDLSGISEERLFSGFSVTPRLSAYLQRKSFIPDMDYVVGADMQMFLPQQLKSTKQSELNNNFWRDYGSSEDRVSTPFAIHWCLILGIQSRY